MASAVVAICSTGRNALLVMRHPPSAAASATPGSTSSTSSHSRLEVRVASVREQSPRTQKPVEPTMA